jgi:hypothetical protein
VCTEKDKRIADLKEMLAREQALVKSLVAPEYPKAINTELNTVLNGSNVPQVEISQDNPTHPLSAAEKQALELLTGTYN